MSTIVLGQSYYLRFDLKLWAAMQPYPPLGTLYAASYLRERGHDVALFDAMVAASEEDWRQVLGRVRPKLAVIYEDNFNYLSKMCLLQMRSAALAMIDIARDRGCTVIVCGSDASDHPEIYLAGGAQFVVIGEGEQTLGELVDRLTGRTSTSFDQISGLTYRASEILVSNSHPQSFQDSLVRTPRRPDIRDLDALPFPAWDLVDVETYRRIWRHRHGYYSMNVVTTRGCPYHCNWCAKPVWGQQYNSRSPENVVAELTWLRQRFHPDHIWFADDIMGLRPGWLLKFAELVQREGVQIPFKSLSRADLLLRDGEVDALRRAGCQIVWLGAESGSQRILDAMEKGIRVAQIVEAARRLHDARIEVGFFLQFGYPGETRGDIEQTFRLVRECRPDDIGVSVAYPLPGTKFHARVKSTLGVKQNWLDSSDLAMLYSGSFTTAFYRQLHHVLHKEFRARKAWAHLRGKASRPSTLRGSDLRQTASFVRHLATLPYARRRLDHLARVPHKGLGPLAYSLAPDEAAQPTPQGERSTVSAECLGNIAVAQAFRRAWSGNPKRRCQKSLAVSCQFSARHKAFSY